MTIRVLMVDPEEALLEAYRDYLSAHSFQVETAATGPEALSKLGTWQPDVLVLEPDMPDAWGEKILDHLRTQPEQPCIPVVVLTCRDRLAIADPVHQHYVKPLSMLELTRSIQNAVKASPPKHPHNNGSDAKENGKPQSKKETQHD